MAFMLLRRNSYIAAVVVAWAFAPVTAQARDGELTSVSVATLSPGDFLWDAAARAVPGDVGIIVSITDQKLYVYRGEALVAVSAVSTGKPGHDTPTGEFTILQKQVQHASSLYDDAPMPYMQRITWDGVAIHAGRDPGYAASHGCVRVPIEFAKRLYGITRLGARVTITYESYADRVPDPPEASVQTPPDVQSTPLDPAPVATTIAYAPQPDQ